LSFPVVLSNRKKYFYRRELFDSDFSPFITNFLARIPSMFKFFSPERHLNKNPEDQKPPSKPVQETSEEPSEETAKRAYDEYVRKQIEKRAGERFLSIEHELDLVFSDNALEAYKKAGYVLKKDSELSFFRLVDLEAALLRLEQLKDEFPDRYQADIKRVRDHAQTIKQIFYDYRSMRQQGEGRGAHDVSALLSALETLQRIDPGNFAADLVDVSNEERRHDNAFKNHVTRDSS
jgi:hypothetical protein